MKLWQTAIFIWCCLALAALAVRIPSVAHLQSSAMEEEDLIYDEEDFLIEDRVDSTVPLSSTASTTGTMVTANPTTATNTAPLERFFAALSGEADHRVVRVMHYGDSQIEEDRITSVIRRYLQGEYGGHGVGLVPLHQTIPTFSLRQRTIMNGKIQSVGEGPQRYLIYGPKYLRRPDNSCYGPMGQVAIMNNELVAGSESIAISFTPLRNSGYHTCVRLFADSTISAELHTDTCYLSGRGAVYGFSLESETGVIVDNIPMRGSIGTVFTEIDSTQLHQFYQTNNVRLIILQYGGNFIAGAKTEQGIRSAVYGLRKQIEYLQRLAPETDILFVGPSDMLVNDEEGMHTNPFVPQMDSLLETMCQKRGVAYFSLYRAMGGDGSMQRWQELGLAGDDGVHFTQAGAEKAGKMIIETWKR